MKKLLKIFKKFKNDNSGAIGIGAMIVFIAMVLVAGIAASVLIQTSTRLESQAMTTGSETTEEVSGGLAVQDVVGHVATDIDMLAITIRVRAGSPDIDLNHTVIEITDGSLKALLSYDYLNPTHFNSSVDDDADLFGTGNISTLTYEQFGIIVLEDPDSSLSRYNPVINRGDLVILTIDTNAIFSEISERSDVYGMIMPEIGSPGMISFTTPASYTDTVYDLQ
jgi:flagellin FlaB